PRPAEDRQVDAGERRRHDDRPRRDDQGRGGTGGDRCGSGSRHGCGARGPGGARGHQEGQEGRGQGREEVGSGWVVGCRMKLVAGLGNPGAEYEWTRHNLGFEVLDGLAAKHRASWSGKPDADIAKWASHAILLKPQTFMNLSGSAVQRWTHFYKV